MAADNKTQIVITALDKTASGIASAQAGLSKFAGSFAGLANPIALAATAATAATAALAASVKGAIDSGDQFNKLSQKTGIAVESLSALAYAGDLADVNIESLSTGIKKLSVNMAEAASNTKSKAAEAFVALGVAVKDASGNLRASDAVLGDVADKFANMKDGAGKTALAVALFGKAGADLIPLLNQGSKGIADMTEEAKKLGLVMTGKMAKDAEEFNDNVRKLSLSMSALGRSIAADLLGPLAQYTKLVVEARKEGAGLISSLAIGLRTDGADTRTLDELRQRAGKLQGTISFLTQGGQTPNDPIFGTKLKNSQAELAILQKQIRERMAQAQEVIPPFAAGAQVEAPVVKDGEGSKKPKKKTDLDRMLELGQRNLAAARAAEYASVDDDEEARLAAGQTNKHSLELARKEADTIERLRQQYVNLADPINKYRVQLDEIEKLKQLGREAGGLDAEQALGAAWKINEAMDAEIARMNDLGEATKETDSFAKDLGLSFSSAFEDAAIGGKGLSDVLKGLTQDVARIVVRKSVTEPLGEAVSGMVKSSGIGKGLGDSFKNLFGFANGGEFTVGGGGGTDSQLVAFRATPGEQVSIRTPAQQSAGGSVVIQQHIYPSPGVSSADLMAAMVQAKNAALAEIRNSQRRGGAFA